MLLHCMPPIVRFVKSPTVPAPPSVLGLPRLRANMCARLRFFVLGEGVLVHARPLDALRFSSGANLGHPKKAEQVNQ